MEVSNASARRPLIRDITVRRAPHNYQRSVPHHELSIGELDARWRRAQIRGYIPRRTPSPQPRPKTRYTRIEPLGVADQPSRSHRAFVRVCSSSRIVPFSLVVAATNIASFISRQYRGVQLKLLPKQYTLREGLRTDWDTRTLVAGRRYAVPVMAVAAIGSMLALSVPFAMHHSDPTYNRDRARTTSAFQNTTENYPVSSGNDGTSTSSQVAIPKSQLPNATGTPQVNETAPAAVMPTAELSVPLPSTPLPESSEPVVMIPSVGTPIVDTPSVEIDL